MEILLLDNHDSFTYNIAHIVRNIKDVNLQIISSDKITFDKIASFDGIIFSPGPDIPRKGNIMERIIQNNSAYIPILGICLGLQAITLCFGGKISRLDEVVHGRTKKIHLTDCASVLFSNIPDEFEAGLYHSWIAEKESFPSTLDITAISTEGRIMALKHKELSIEAVQFHPESIMTPYGIKIITNWIESVK